MCTSHPFASPETGPGREIPERYGGWCRGVSVSVISKARGHEGADASSRAPRPILAFFSSGKDSTWMLSRLRSDPAFEVRGLVTTVNEQHGRVAMHGVRASLLAAQAERIGLPLVTVPLPWPCTNEDYETRMRDALAREREAGITGIAFGDLFLEDIRAYRERQAKALDLEPHFPIWGEDTHALAHEMVAAGTKAVVTCLNPRVCPAELAGAEFDEAFLSRLPPDVDACGEYGEFHTFVFDAPCFDAPIDVVVGETVVRDGFVFTDVRSAEETT